jgi:regulator of RNase E activity RraA
MTKKTLGRLPLDAIRRLELPRLPDDVLDGFRALVDLTGTISDACDQLGIVAVVPAYVLPPVNLGKRVVGPALTVRTIARDVQVHKAAQDGINTQGETEAHNLAEPGDVLVIEGVMGCSNMGGQSATIGRRQGEAGAIVDGTLRDPEQYRGMGWPVWCRGYTPITGKWRMQTVEVNGTVQICGIPVKPGDLVCADDAGVAFVPRERAADVLTLCRRIDEADTRRKKDIDGGASVS